MLLPTPSSRRPYNAHCGGSLLDGSSSSRWGHATQHLYVRPPQIPAPYLTNRDPPHRAITSETRAWATALNEPLKETDPDLFGIIEKEKVRQQESLVLIASENFTSKCVFLGGLVVAGVGIFCVWIDAHTGVGGHREGPGRIRARSVSPNLY